jgi:hypothetical protein
MLCNSLAALAQSIPYIRPSVAPKPLNGYSINSSSGGGNSCSAGNGYSSGMAAQPPLHTAGSDAEAAAAAAAVSTAETTAGADAFAEQFAVTVSPPDDVMAYYRQLMALPPCPGEPSHGLLLYTHHFQCCKPDTLEEARYIRNMLMSLPPCPGEPRAAVAKRLLYA